MVPRERQSALIRVLSPLPIRHTSEQLQSKLLFRGPVRSVIKTDTYLQGWNVDIRIDIIEIPKLF